MTLPSRSSRFRGALLGTLLGDALGRPFEGMSVGDARLAPGLARKLHNPGPWLYSDDAQMTMALARSLVRHGGFERRDFLESLAEHHDPARGYGKGMNLLLRAHRAGTPPGELPFLTWPSGSSGNGASARVAPLACLYHDSAALASLADASAAVTHAHPTGRAGCVIQATAIARVLRAPFEIRLRPASVLEGLAALAAPLAPSLAGRLERAGQLLLDPDAPPARVAEELGNGVSADESVPAALYVFAAHGLDFERTVTAAITLGGDTDTVGAMAGALIGALVGEEGIPPRWIAQAEGGSRGAAYVIELADGLAALRRRGVD